MTIQFLLQDLPLDRNEVLALMEPGLNGSAKPIKIELSDFIVGSFSDSQKLFEMAVKNNNKGLVDIAWKIAMTKGTSTQKPNAKKPVGFDFHRNVRASEKAHTSLSVEDLIEKLNSHQANWATGAAMLLQATSKGEYRTLKDIACTFVNSNAFDSNSVNYKGFELNRYNGMYEPVELRVGVERKFTFHVSPIYIGLREGLVWCKKNDLVLHKNGISYGSNSKTTQGTNQMQRIYYKVKANERGEELVKLWADMDNYIMSFCNAR